VPVPDPEIVLGALGALQSLIREVTLQAKFQVSGATGGAPD